MTDRMHRVDVGVLKERLKKKLEEEGPEALTKAEMQVLHSNRADRRKNGFKRQNHGRRLQA